MQAEVMAIGDELTSGQRLDTNSQWLSQQLGQTGVRVAYHTTVADDRDELAAAFRTATRRASLVVTSGGLGPTADDLTRQGLADAAHRGLLLQGEVLRQIRRRFKERGRRMSPQNQIQAWLPQGSRVIPNPHGTAPGIDLDLTSPGGHPSRVFALPGVPAEMKVMWHQTVQPAIRGMLGEVRLICHRRLKCFGVGESELESLLPDLIRRGRDPQVGITVHRATITLRVSTTGPNREDCLRRMEPTLDTIRRCLGTLVFGEEDDELQHVVTRQLAARAQSLAVCEWGTQGLVSHWMRQVDPASRPVLHGAVVVSTPQSLASLLGLSGTQRPLPDPAVQAADMADAVRRCCGTDFGLAIGPLADHSGSFPQIQLALATPDGPQVQARPYTGHPDILLERAAKQALDLLRLELLKDTPVPQAPLGAP